MFRRRSGPEKPVQRTQSDLPQTCHWPLLEPNCVSSDRLLEFVFRFNVPSERITKRQRYVVGVKVLAPDRSKPRWVRNRSGVVSVVRPGGLESEPLCQIKHEPGIRLLIGVLQRAYGSVWI